MPEASLSRLTARACVCAIAIITTLAIFASCSSAEEATQTPSATETPSATVTPSASPTPTLASTSSPTAVVTATPTPTATGAPGAQFIPTPPPRDLYELGRRLVLKITEPVDPLASPAPSSLQAGDTLPWNVNRDEGTVTVDATVALVTENAYWLFEDEYPVDEERLAEAAEEFEQDIWPTVTGAFGNIWTPGIDGDPRLVIFHGKLRSGVAGYFVSADEYPVAIQPKSNQRETIYMSADNLGLGSAGYSSTLAHELQHAIHWVTDPDEDSWVNEGISELASKLAGYPPGSVNAFLRSPNTSLLDWEPDIFQASPNYGAAALFFEYLYDHYGGADTIRSVIESPADSIASIDLVLTERGYEKSMIDVYEEWLVANFADDENGAYSHPERNTPAPFTHIVTGAREINDSVKTFGSNYYSIDSASESITLSFSGETHGQIFQASPLSGSTCWWTNTGDSIDSTLTRRMDLSGVSEATLNFHAWTSIETEWDYLYLVVSTDNGVTWDIVSTERSTDSDPNGVAFGPGITGSTQGWQEDSADLSDYAGQEILLRFEHITDDAVHGRGACLDDFSIPEIGWTDDTSNDDEWTTEGFARINDLQPVEYSVQVIRDTADGPAIVERIEISPDGEGQVTVARPATGEQLIVVVSAVTPNVSGELDYTLEIS